MGRKPKARARFDSEKGQEIRRLWRSIMHAQLELYQHVSHNWPVNTLEHRLKEKAQKSMMGLCCDLDALLFEVADGYDLGTTLYDEVPKAGLTALHGNRDRT